MNEQTYWVALGKAPNGNYAQALIDQEYWKNSMMKDSSTQVIVEIIVNTKTGSAGATIIKNDI